MPNTVTTAKTIPGRNYRHRWVNNYRGGQNRVTAEITPNGLWLHDEINENLRFLTISELARLAGMPADD